MGSLCDTAPKMNSDSSRRMLALLCEPFLHMFGFAERISISKFNLFKWNTSGASDFQHLSSSHKLSGAFSIPFHCHNFPSLTLPTYADSTQGIQKPNHVIPLPQTHQEIGNALRINAKLFLPVTSQDPTWLSPGCSFSGSPTALLVGNVAARALNGSSVALALTLLCLHPLWFPLTSEAFPEHLSWKHLHYHSPATHLTLFSHNVYHVQTLKYVFRLLFNVCQVPLDSKLQGTSTILEIQCKWPNKYLVFESRSEQAKGRKGAFFEPRSGWGFSRIWRVGSKECNPEVSKGGKWKARTRESKGKKTTDSPTRCYRILSPNTETGGRLNRVHG